MRAPIIGWAGGTASWALDWLRLSSHRAAAPAAVRRKDIILGNAGHAGSPPRPPDPGTDPLTRNLTSYHIQTEPSNPFSAAKSISRGILIVPLAVAVTDGL